MTIAEELPPPRWENIRIDRHGNAVAGHIGMLSEAPSPLPSWPSNADDMAFLEEDLEVLGLNRWYLNVLARIAGDIATATPRQKSEAALMAFRESACHA
jgi:hypothetical protein